MNLINCRENRFKKSILTFFLVSQTMIGIGQLSYNGGFEFENGQHLPRVWFVQTKKDYTVLIDTTVSFHGKKSIAIVPTAYYNEFSEVMFWQELNISGFKPFKTLKIVAYVKADNFDSVKLKIGFNKVCSEGLQPDTGVLTVEPVIKDAVLWHKVTFKSNLDSNCKRTNIWNVIHSTATIVHIDDIELFIDDKKIDDIPLEKRDFPDKRSIDWIDHTAKIIGTDGFGSNLGFFQNEIGQCEIVALGESSHGTKEFSTLRLGLIKKLVNHNDFSVFVFENQLESSLNINIAL